MPSFLRAVTNWAGVDGRTSAPVGAAAQRPTLFTGLIGVTYPVRPPWHVAGVDYGVGLAAGTVLKDPLVSVLPTGATADTVNKLIRCNSTNDLTFDGWDFSLNGGYTLYVDGTTDRTTVTNSKFGIGSTGKGIITSDAGAGSLTVRYCLLDGGGDDNAPGGGATYLIRAGSKANSVLTVEYCLLKRPHGDCINPGSGNDVVVRYNLFEDLAYDPTVGAGVAHVDMMQIQSVPIGDVDMSFNTFYQPAVYVGGGLPGSVNSFIIFTSLSGIAGDVNLSNNTLTGSGTDHHTATGDNGRALNYAFYIVATLPAEIRNPRANDNYVDPGSLNGLAFPTPGNGVSGSSFLRNIKLTDGTAFSAPY